MKPFQFSPKQDDVRSNGDKLNNNQIYITSSFRQHFNNEAAMKNSTLILQNVKSKELLSISPKQESKTKPINPQDFKVFDRYSVQRSPLHNKQGSLTRIMSMHYLPKYQGFVPGIKSENMFGKSSTEIADKCIRDFQIRRNNIGKSDFNVDYRYNPLSKSIGVMKNNIFDQVVNHQVNNNLNESGYIHNSSICDGRGWTPDKILNPKKKTTEYRVSMNKNKEVIYVKNRNFLNSITK